MVPAGTLLAQTIAAKKMPRFLGLVSAHGWAPTYWNDGRKEQAPTEGRNVGLGFVHAPLEPFLVEGNLPVRPGQVRRASLLPVWQWLIRDGAPDQVSEFEAVLARMRETGAATGLEAAVRKLQLAAADAIFKIAMPVTGGDTQRALSRVLRSACPVKSATPARGR